MRMSTNQDPRIGLRPIAAGLAVAVAALAQMVLGGPGAEETGGAGSGQEPFTFVQMCDTQLGMGGYEHDVRTFERAVEVINGMEPDFVVICGDLVDRADDQSFADFKKIRSGFKLPCYCASGNHDVGNQPSAESLRRYREKIGPDYYTFEHKGFTFVVANTQLWKAPLAGESEKHDEWFRRALEDAKARRSPAVLVVHYPLFIEKPDEKEVYFNLPVAKRKEVLDLCVENGVVAILGGHLHRFAANEYKGIKLVNGETTSKNFDKRPMGFRFWEVDANGGMTHRFIGLDRSLRRSAARYFDIGVGIGHEIVDREADWPLLTTQFSGVTPENCMKIAALQPVEGEFHWEEADRLVKFARGQGLTMVGHCLVWAKDDRTPAWIYRDGDGEASKALLLERMEAHIDRVAGRYRGQVVAWDVVNEALADGGEENDLRPSSWLSIAGDDFIAKAFEFAHRADPDAILIYNDYHNELPPKRAKMIRLLRSLKARGAPVHAVGIQGHYTIDKVPFDDIEATLVAMRELELKVFVSELDIDMVPRDRWWADGGAHREELATLNPFPDGLPVELARRQADQYARLFRLFKQYADVVERVTFWNLHDGRSWLNSFPWERTNHPLLFDRASQPKPAFDAVIEALEPS